MLEATENWQSFVLAETECFKCAKGTAVLHTGASPTANDGFHLACGESIVISAGKTLHYRRGYGVENTETKIERIGV